MNTTTEIERDQTNLPLHLQVERDYVQTLGLRLHTDASPGLFGDLTESMRPDGGGWKPRTSCMSSGGMAAVLERYRNAEGDRRVRDVIA